MHHFHRTPIDGHEDVRKLIKLFQTKRSNFQGIDSPCKQATSQETNNSDEPNFIDDPDKAYIVLLNVFRYLSLHDLLSVACVSKLWNLVASDNSFWKEVKVKNCYIYDCEAFGKALKVHNTEALDLKEMEFCFMLINDGWEKLCTTLKDVTSLTKIDMGVCSLQAITMIVKVAPQLTSLTSLDFYDEESFNIYSERILDVSSFSNLTNLAELILKSSSESLIINNLDSLKNLNNLTTLSLKKLDLICLENHLPSSLVSLELGVCTRLTKEFAVNCLPTLVNLKRLRLEKGLRPCQTVTLLNSIAALQNLNELELVNFDFNLKDFDSALGKCTNLKKLLIIPIYERHRLQLNPITNRLIVSGVSKLKESLQHFMWVFNLLSIESTNNLICRVNARSIHRLGHGEGIPIENASQSNIYVVSFENLKTCLTYLLPQTKVSILKVPFIHTWKQSLACREL